MIEVNLSLIGQEVNMISPKLRLHWDMRRTVVWHLVLPLFVFSEIINFADVVSQSPSVNGKRKLISMGQIIKMITD